MTKTTLHLTKWLLLAFCFLTFSVQAQFNFTNSGLKNITITNPTSLQFGPDGRLYVAEQDGLIKVFTITRNGPNDYTATATETISLINQIPNHDDNGAVNPSVTTRQVTGLLVRGTATNPVIYVSSSDSRIGGPSGDLNLDTNSGIVSMLTWNGSTWVKLDLVRGFPRSEENHSVNGLQLDDSKNMLYLAIGGNTNAGSPSTNFAYTCEYALSAAIVSIDLNAINAMPTIGSGNTAYKYNLPTVDDPTRANNADGTDVNDPFGGNDGLNQAKIVANGPVKIFSPGYRNVYDLVITKARKMYAIDNGANQGWGGYPENEGTASVTNNYVAGEPGSTTGSGTESVINNLDNLHYIANLDTYVSGSFYAGHPNPTRANPAGAGLYTHDGTVGVFRTSKSGANPLPADWPPVPAANAVEGDFRMPGVADGALLTFPNSTNGITEYTASAFNGALKGALLAASLGGTIYKIGLTADGTNTTNAKAAADKLNQDQPLASNFGSEPLDVTAQGDSDIFPGTFWVATYGSGGIIVFEPQGSTGCSGAHNMLDEDGDGYTNADELDNGTNPCSASSRPPDADGDKISDLNDPDDDNDGIPDKQDPFAIDANNGQATLPPVTYDLFNNNPGKGFFGLGFTGLMSNHDSDYLKLYNPDNLIAGGAVGAFSVVNVPAGDALGALNTQQNGFQFGVKTDGLPFTARCRLLAPFFNGSNPTGAQSQGFYIGNGDQDNYLKITLNANGALPGIQVVYENAGVVTSQQFPLPTGMPGSTLDLFLKFNASNNTVQSSYAADGGSMVNVGSPIPVGGAVLNAVQGSVKLAVGLIATSRDATPFTASWDYIYLSHDAVGATGSWQTLTPTSGNIIAREENAYVQAGDKFYLMGGRGADPVQEYNPATKAWVNKSTIVTELNHFQPVTLDGLVYIMGAFAGPFPHEVPVPDIYVYNPLSDQWLKGPGIPQNRRRGSTGAVVYNNKIYLVGGITDGHWAGWVKWFDEYDPATNTWRTLPDAPRERDHFQVVVINNKLYVAGGRRSSASTDQPFDLTIPEVDVFDFGTGTWSTLPSASNLPTQRGGASNVALGNELLVIAGESSQPAGHVETEALNVTTNTWRRLADLQQGRHGTQAISNNGGVFIAAGAGNQGGGPLLSSQEVFYFYAPTTPDGIPVTQSGLAVPGSVSFGSVDINAKSTRSITLTNQNGNQAILVTAITISGATAFTYSTPVPLPFVLAPGKSVDIAVSFQPATQGSQTGTLLINHSGQNGSTAIGLSGNGGLSSSSQTYKVNAGGPQLTNSIGSFEADNYFTPSPGTTYKTTTSISGTADPEMYQTERFGSSFGYGFPVPAGQYKVVLHFAEIYFTSTHNRLFDVSIEGTKVLDNYDIVAKVGAFTATTETFNVTVNDGTLNVDFSSLSTDGGIDNAKIAAIEILPAGPAVSSFTLVNADNEQDIQPLTNGAVLNLATLPTRNLNIRANTNPATVGSVLFNLTGQQTRSQSESGAPYSLFGDVSGDYNAWTPAVGSYNLTATSYSASGTAGAPLAISFTVTEPAPVNQSPTADAGPDKNISLPVTTVVLDGAGTDADGTVASYSWSQVSGPNTASFSSKTVTKPTVSGLVAGSYVFALVVTDNLGAKSAADQVTVLVKTAVASFTLVNADNNRDIQPLTNGAVLNLATLPTRHLNIRANTNPATVGSVSFNLTGQQTRNEIDSKTPYALFGDKKGSYNPWTPSVGSYNLKATPYSASGATGTAGTALTITFSVTNQAALHVATPGAAENEAGLQPGANTRAVASPNPSDDGRYNITLPVKWKGGFTYVLLSANGSSLTDGKQILSEPTSVLSFDFSRQTRAAGVYYLQLNSNSGQIVLKLVRTGAH